MAKYGHAWMPAVPVTLVIVIYLFSQFACR